MKLLLQSLLFFFLLGLYTGCKSQLAEPRTAVPESPGSEHREQVTLITGTPELEAAYPDAYAYFRQQKDRFEFDDCRLYYNGQQLKLDTLHHMEKILGTDYEDKLNLWFMDKPVIIMDQGVWTGRPFAEGSEMIGIVGTTVYIKMSQDEERYNPTRRDSLSMSVPILDGYVLLNGIPVNNTMPIEEINARIQTHQTGMQFQEYLYPSLQSMRYSVRGEYFPQCCPDKRLKNLGIRHDWIFLSISYNDELGSIIHIKYSYRLVF